MYRLLRNGFQLFPNTYKFFASTVQLSEERKREIDERRGRLKFEIGDPEILRIIIEEMLAYKPTLMTLDDRYLQLEQILDAIDTAKSTKQMDSLITLCNEIAKDILSSPGTFKNSFLECLQKISFRISAAQNIKLKSKL